MISTSLVIWLYQLLIALFSISPSVNNQEPKAVKNYPKDYFRSPLDIPLILAGSFGELRSNHFHSGVDIKTNKVEGLPVYAVADGYVSRVRIQSGGFGNALYITHPNGFVSVYAHLRNYNWKIKGLAKTRQYKQESFEIDEFLSPLELPVKKGDVIAYSGNTGGSTAPHLHFEIRDQKTEETINPLLFGFNIKDEVFPSISYLYIYPIGNSSAVNGLANTLKLPIIGSSGDYSLSKASELTVQGEIGFGISTVDMFSEANNKNGVYSIELKQNGKRIYYSVMERFFFSETKNINSFIDYAEKKNVGRYVQKSYIDNGNKLSIYKEVLNRGILKFNKDSRHEMEYIVADYAGNISRLKFNLHALDEPVPARKITGYNAKMDFSSLNTFNAEGIKLSFPINCFYDTLYFTYSSDPRPAKGYSLLHHVHNDATPINNSYTISIKADDAVLPYKDKALIVNETGKSYGGGWENGYVSTKMKTFGSFYVSVDTVAPKIKPINILNGKSMTANSAILIKISDDLSGIKSYRATIDDKWVLMDFDAKYALLTHNFDERSGPGEHTFKLVVRDGKNNLSEYTATFNR